MSHPLLRFGLWISPRDARLDLADCMPSQSMGGIPLIDRGTIVGAIA
jgi:hypothetical protein